MKGVLVVAQSGGPTPVINASLVGIIREAKNHNCFTGVYGLEHGIEGALKEEMIDLSAMQASTENDELLDKLERTPASALGSSRYKLKDADYARISEVFHAHDVRYFVYIGGNGSMFVCDKLATENPELRVMGVPKTIDNDLAGTDHTPGYGSAARFLALAVRDTGRDLESMTTFDDVFILEAMGRDSGWLAAATALLKETDNDAPHLVYVPENPFDENRFLDDVKRVHAHLQQVFVVVGEGIRDEHGHFIGQQQAATDTMGRVVYSLLSGAGQYLVNLLREKLGYQARVLRPGVIGRAFSACVSEIDRREALLAGVEAVKLLTIGKSGCMVSLKRIFDKPYSCTIETVPLSEAAGKEKHIPREFVNAEGNMVTQSFHRYALPLIGELPSPLARLSDVRVSKRLSEDMYG
jgi:6-phosphofructokinase 1